MPERPSDGSPPAGGTSEASAPLIPLGELADAAARAIAPDGVRGWRLRPRDNAVEILVDPDQIRGQGELARLVALASGAALLNLRTALAGLGAEPSVTMWPDGQDQQVLASVRAGRHDGPLGPRANGVPVHRDGFRHTVDQLAASARAEGATLLVASNDLLRDAFTLGGRDSTPERWIAGHAELTILGSTDDSVDALVRAGQAMQRVATQAFTLSLSARLVFGCFADLRTRWRVMHACPGAVPQVLIGFAPSDDPARDHP